MKKLYTLILIACVLPFAADARVVEVVESSYLHCNDTVLVYSPVVQKAGKRMPRRKQPIVKDIPTLILLHGFSDNYQAWSNHMDLQALANETGFRIITPDGFYASWYFNNINPSKMQWRSFFWNELWPLLDEKYGLPSDRTFIAGLSMGGHGAMNIFLDHPDRFRGAGSMSGVLDLKSTGTSRYMIPEILGAKSIMDPVCTEVSAISRVGRVKEVCGEEGAKDKILVITCGQQDKAFIGCAYDFEKVCMEEGVRHVLMTTPARHNWAYWPWVIRYHLGFFSEILAGSSIGEK